MATINDLNGLVIAQDVFEAFTAEVLPIMGFSTSFESEARQLMETLRVPIATAITAADYNASSNNYEKGGGRADGTLVTLDTHKVTTFSMTDLQAGKTPAKIWESMVREGFKGLGRAIFQEVIGKFTATTFGDVDGTSKSITTAANFDLDTVAEIDGLLTKRNAHGPRTLIATIDYATSLKKDNKIQDVGAYGSDDVVRSGRFGVPMYNIRAFESNLFPTALTNENTGVVLAVPEALAVAARPVMPQSGAEQVLSAFDIISDPAGTGLSVGYREHYAPSTGTRYGTVEILLGITAVQTAGAVRVVSA